MDITKKGLELLETINKYMIDDRTSQIAEEFFFWDFSIYNVNHQDHKNPLVQLEIYDNPEKKGEE